MSVADRALLRLSLSSAAVLALLGGPVLAQDAPDRSSIVDRSAAPAKSEPAAKPPAAPASEEASPPARKDCVATYHASLKVIEAGDFAAIAAARRSVTEGDPGLPGQWIYPARPAPRSKAEMAALSTASILVKGRDRQGATGSEADWIANRIRVDLGDYLGQKATPFLCGGVPQYVATLRRFADRTGANPERTKTFAATQVEAARRTLAAALAAMKPVAPPRFAPDDRPAPMAAMETEGLRPAAGLSREDVAPPKPADQTGSVVSDPDLPPRRPETPLALASVSERIAALNLVMTAAKTAGLVPAGTDEAALHAGSTVVPISQPVLQRLAELRPFVLGDQPIVTDAKVRAAMIAAFTDIEALDYLARATERPADPVSGSINKTLDAILDAQKRDCTCGG